MINKKILILLLILIILAGGFYFFTRINQTNRQDTSQFTVMVNLYFSTRDAMYLLPESRQINKIDLYTDVVKGLIRGPQNSNLSPTLPEGTEILQVRVKDGISYLNFNKALVENHWGGSTGEILTIYSLVNTMTQFDEIKKVQILIEGNTVETLAGHLDISEPIEPNLSLVNNNN